MLKQFWKSERHYNTQPKQGVNQRRLSQKKLRYRDTNRGKQGRVRSPEFSLAQSGGIHAARQQPPNSGHADIATIMAKKSASMANSTAFSPAR